MGWMDVPGFDHKSAFEALRGGVVGGKGEGCQMCRLRSSGHGFSGYVESGCYLTFLGLQAHALPPSHSCIWPFRQKRRKKKQASLSQSKTAVSFSLSISILLARYSQHPHPEHLEAPPSFPQKRCECFKRKISAIRLKSLESFRMRLLRSY